MDLPKEWAPMPKTSGKEDTVYLCNLSQTSPEYQNVSTQFYSTGGSGTIDMIQRIQNPHLYRQYMVRKMAIDKQNVGIKNEMELFHGTSWNKLDDINKTNFNRNFCGEAHGECKAIFL